MAIHWSQGPTGCCNHLGILVHLGFSFGNVGGKLNTNAFPQQGPLHAHLEHLHPLLPHIVDIQHSFPAVFWMGKHLLWLDCLLPGKTTVQKHLEDMVHLYVDWLLGVHDLIDFGSDCRWQPGCLLWLGHGKHLLQ